MKHDPFHDRALRLIREARETAAEELRLSDLLSAELCEELATLPSLKKLYLDGHLNDTREWDDSREPFRDLSALRSLSSLTGLEIHDAAVEDLTPISSLPALRILCLSKCNGITDLSALLGLGSLEVLELKECQFIASLEGLRNLTGLLELDLSDCDGVADLEPLRALTRLTKLNLAGCGKRFRQEHHQLLVKKRGLKGLTDQDRDDCERIASLEPLRDLIRLTVLDLSETFGLRNLYPLRGLGALTSLKLSDCRLLTSLEPLSGLGNLTHLSLDGCEALTSIAPLAGLSALTNLYLDGCQGLATLEPLHGLARLSELSLVRCGQLKSIAPLKGLPALAVLSLRECPQLESLEPLRCLKSIVSLDLSGCANMAFEPVRELLGGLKSLTLDNTKLDDLPVELCGRKYAYDECIHKVRAYYADNPTEPNSDVKVFVLGNGRVGKTKLVGRLQGVPFEEIAEGSTHGVKIRDLQLDVHGRPDPVNLNIWDFGGQDIYHGTHSLFLRGPAIYLVLWSADCENDDDVSESGVAMKNRRLQYWIDYLLAEVGVERDGRRVVESPVLFIQSKCDKKADERRPESEPDPGAFPNLYRFHISAKSDRGLKALVEGLQEAVSELFSEHPNPPLPRSWIEVRAKIRELPRLTPPVRTLSMVEFAALCPSGVSRPDVVLTVLHLGGVLFHSSRLFEGRVIVDQSWALDAIYTVFHREKTAPKLKRLNGRFTRELLAALAWPEKTESDQSAIIAMMKSCGVCFEVRRLPEGVWEYAAPDLLPGRHEVEPRLADRIPASPPDAWAEADYAFLHEGILRTFLAGIGALAEDSAEYWKYGCYFYEATTKSRIRVTSALTPAGSGRVNLDAWGPAAVELAARVLGFLKRIPTGHPPTIRTTWADRPAIEQQAERPFVIAAEPRSNREIFVSYGWGVTESEVSAMCEKLKEWGNVVLRDKQEMKPGDSINQFMKRAGGASRVLLVIGEKYLASEFCMTELFEVFARTGGNDAEFRARVIPITLPGTKIFSMSDRAERGLFWKQEFEKLQSYCSQGVLGADDYPTFQAMMNWALKVATVLKHVVDMLHPIGFEAASANDWQVLKEMIQEHRTGD